MHVFLKTKKQTIKRQWMNPLFKSNICPLLNRDVSTYGAKIFLKLPEKYEQMDSYGLQNVLFVAS